MGAVKDPAPVFYFVSIIFGEKERMESAKEKTTEILGVEAQATDPAAFYQTDYYEKEMGKDLSRVFVLFDSLLPRDRLAEVKLRTNDVEALLSRGKDRCVNIDPGYLSLENVVLATTKGYSHRIYLGQGVFGDLALMFYRGTYKPLEWTYPDYRNGETIALFNRWRTVLKDRIRGKG